MTNGNDKDLFFKLKEQLLNIDPVAFCQKNLTLDGESFTLNGNGYKPFSDIYRYIGIKALEPGSKPVIMVKGRQVGATTMASALEMYFMGSGLFGDGFRPPIRVIHAFPQLELAAAYSKTKLNQMISQAKIPDDAKENKAARPKSCMQSLLDQSTATNDSLHFKQFMGGNHLWIESVGIDGDRIMGRQLCLETELPTPTGFIKLKDLKEGDQLFDEQGNICNVTKLHPINYSPEAYKITFDDGTTADACADHLWLTYTRKNRRKHTEPTIKNTKEIFQTLKDSRENNHSIPCTKPLNYSEKDLLLDPYLLGLWLGDGNQKGSIESADPEILDDYKNHVVQSSIRKSGNSFSDKPSRSHSYRVDGLTTKLIKLNQMYNSHHSENAKNKQFYNKHIPEIYMRASFEQRLSLIQGLMDTDGHCDKNGNIEFVQVRKNLALQVYELVLSLGIKAYLYKRESWRYDKQYKDKYRIRFKTNLPVFRMKRKLDRIDSKVNTKISHRFICNVERIDSVPMRCITVDSESHLFLITKQCIPTHNTADVIFFDECFPYTQKIATNDGKKSIGQLFNAFSKKEELPLVMTFNLKSQQFEYKPIVNVFKRNKRKLIQISLCGRKIECTDNHRFLTEFGWQQIKDVQIGTLIKSYVDNNYLSHSWLSLDKKEYISEEKVVYDIEVKDNHNFILAPNKKSNYQGGPIVHNCQKTTSQAIGNSLKVLTTAKYGTPSKGVQVYFGTPRRKGSDFHKMWQRSSQQYYYLGCEYCKDYFPLYTPGSDDWEKVWIREKIVKCTKCGHEQDKLSAQERGKWVAVKDPNDEDCEMIGFHINQLYMPMFTREQIEKEKPGVHPINTERVFMNEVLGEFFQGDSSPITKEEIDTLCADRERKFSARILPSKSLTQQFTMLGIDYGARADLEQLANPDTVKAQGQSYSTAVVLLTKGPGLLSVEFCTKFKRNDMESKKGIIDQLMRQYNINLAIGDIGYSNDFSYVMHQAYGDKYIVSRAHNKVNEHVKFNADAFPKELVFERDYYIGELYEQMKKGMIRFPYGDYEKVAWLVEHCASMEIKPSISRGGDPSIHYVKGGTPNDGFMALLNAYLAYKFIISRGFTNNNPLIQNDKHLNKPMVLGGYVRRKI